MTVSMLTTAGNSKLASSYNSLPGGCGGHFITDEGTFDSPNYPDIYPHNSDCEWLLGSVLQLYSRSE
jgi:hypothetical protein